MPIDSEAYIRLGLEVLTAKIYVHSTWQNILNAFDDKAPQYVANLKCWLLTVLAAIIRDLTMFESDPQLVLCLIF